METKNRKIEDLLDLAPEDDDDEKEVEFTEEDVTEARDMIQKYKEAVSDGDIIDAALPQVAGLEDHDKDMDELAEEAKNAYEDLFALGFNVDSKDAGRILETAAAMMGHAISAKNSKADRKLKMIDLQLKKRRLDQAEAKQNANPNNPIQGEGRVVDRNELLRALRKEK